MGRGKRVALMGRRTHIKRVQRPEISVAFPLLVTWPREMERFYNFFHAQRLGIDRCLVTGKWLMLKTVLHILVIASNEDFAAS